ncbi:hypothetical protein CWC48_22400 [Pseudomonas sp. S10E 269]|nr:hypothetical protein CWC49_02850 [Pseudomonas sp. S09F 262]PJK43284.1 hypothetical protein CWC48_22400 [Pseudomonas sp. S10E 269]
MLIIMNWNIVPSAAFQTTAAVMSAIALLGCQPPTRADFIKYPSLQQRWSMICDPRSNIADANVEGCQHFHEWQAASRGPVLDNLMNQHLGK